MRTSKFFLPIVAALAVLLALASCTYRRSALDMEWDYTPGQRDSIKFVHTHHYSQNYNFKVHADSLMLLSVTPDDPVRPFVDTVYVHEGDLLVVADFAYAPADTVDTVWIKVAHDQATIGWLHEKELLGNAVPDDPISEFIHFFGSKRNIALCVVAIVAAAVYLIHLVRRKKIRIVHFNDIDSLYPSLLCLDIAVVAVLYATIQHFVPQTWQEFYFNPTLNPFILPPVLAAMITGVWLMVLLDLATVDDVARILGRGGALPYLLSLLGMSLVVYMVFAATTYIYLGYALLVAYVVFAVMRYRRNRTYRYLCGRCGHKLRHKGTCPYCGASNM